MVLWAAKRVGRPVKWLSGRSETFVCDPHGRDHVTRAEMAFDAEGRVLGVRIRTVAAMGAYLQDFGPRIPTVAGGRINGTVYDIQALNVQVRCVFTNTSPTDAYRGAGRPETAYVLERLLDAGAAAFGIGRDEIRRRNYIRPEQIPYTNAAGNPIDSGRFAETQEHGAGAGGLGRLPGAAGGSGEARQAARHRHRLLHRGLGRAAERMGAGALRAGRHGGADGRHLQPRPGARDGLRAGAAREARHPLRLACASSRATAPSWSRATAPAARAPRRWAASPSRAPPSWSSPRASGWRRTSWKPGVGDVEFADGAFRIVGTDLRADWARVVEIAHDPARLPEGEAPGLDEQLLYTRNTECNFPNGCHVAEVEVDEDTGQVEVVRYAAVDDVGNVINPMLVHGQSHGGIVAGIGQALLEHAVYDPESGQFLTATFQDYCMPRASDAPSFDLGFNVVPCPNNDLGVKGAGEGGACGAPPAVVSAVCDALGVAHIDMPLTPERVWRAMAAAA